MYDIIIIGAGTAGMSAAIYGARAGKKVLMIESNNYGGQIIYSSQIDNYPAIKHISGFEFANVLYEQVVELGVEIIFEEAIEIITTEGFTKKVITDNSEYETKTIIIATGTTNRLLGLPREKEFIGLGISYCATCDGAFFRNKPVAIIGGGNTALEEAIELSEFCSQVYLIHRRGELRGEKALQDKLETIENVTYMLNSKVEELKGEQRISSIVVRNIETNENTEVHVNGVFVAIGKIPETKLVKSIIDCTKEGYIKASEDCKTSLEGIFVAGDCRTKDVRQLATAAADGAVAAIAAGGYISNLF